MMSGSHQEFFNIIILQSLHTLNSTAASVLASEIIHCHSLDISTFGHCYHCIFSWNQILCRNIIHIITNGSLSVISIFLGNCQDFFSDYSEKEISVCKNGFVFTYFLHKICIFCFQLLSFQTCQSTKTHVYNSLSLYIR